MNAIIINPIFSFPPANSSQPSAIQRSEHVLKPTIGGASSQETVEGGTDIRSSGGQVQMGQSVSFFCINTDGITLDGPCFFEA